MKRKYLVTHSHGRLTINVSKSLGFCNDREALAHPIFFLYEELMTDTEG